MENLVLSLELVFPMLVYMVLGFVAKRWLKLGDGIWDMNRLVYSVFLPLVLFNSIYQADFKQDFDLKVLIFAFVSIIVAFLILLFFVPKFEKEPKNSSVMIQGVYRANYALFGMAMTGLLYGESNLGMAGILAAVNVPTFAVLSVLLFELARGGKMDFKNVLKNILKNPLIIACALGLVFQFLNIRIPELVLIPVQRLGQMATPLALIVLGAIFSLDNVRKYRKQITFIVLGKLVFMPLIFIPLARAFGITGINLYVLMTLYASPTAVSSFPMATELGGNRELAGLAVAITSVCAIVTFFLWTFVLKQLAWV